MHINFENVENNRNFFIMPILELAGLHFKETSKVNKMVSLPTITI